MCGRRSTGPYPGCSVAPRQRCRSPVVPDAWSQPPILLGATSRSSSMSASLPPLARPSQHRYRSRLRPLRNRHDRRPVRGGSGVPSRAAVTRLPALPRRPRCMREWWAWVDDTHRRIIMRRCTPADGCHRPRSRGRPAVAPGYGAHDWRRASRRLRHDTPHPSPIRATRSVAQPGARVAQHAVFAGRAPGRIIRENAAGEAPTGRSGITGNKRAGAELVRAAGGCPHDGGGRWHRERPMCGRADGRKIGALLYSPAARPRQPPRAAIRAIGMRHDPPSAISPRHRPRPATALASGPKGSER